MADLTWEACPECGECTATHRIGKPLKTTVVNGKLHTEVNRRKKCDACGTEWNSELPTLKEAFGFDGEEETAF